MRHLIEELKSNNSQPVDQNCQIEESKGDVIQNKNESVNHSVIEHEASENLQQ